MPRSCRVISASTRQTLQPACRSRWQSSGSSPAAAVGSKPPTASNASARIIESPPHVIASPIGVSHSRSARRL